MSAVKSVAKFISKMFVNFSRVPDNAIKFIFTGRKNNKESKKWIQGKIRDSIKEQNEEEKAD